MSIPVCVVGGTGFRSRATGGHDPDAFVETGSLTKVVTGTLLTRLAERGTVSMDDPLERWLPAPVGTGITLRHLAGHTSGLPRVPPGLRWAFNDPWRDFTDSALRDLLPGLDTLLTAPAGEREEYSNLGYAVLGAALCAAGGGRYEDLAHEHVLAPLGLESGAMTANPPTGRVLRTRGVLGRRLRPWTMDGAVLPAGGLWASCAGMGRLVTGLLVDRVLGEPAPTWQRAGRLLWHNGATRTASVFAGALSDGRWMVMHRLSGAASRTDRLAVAEFRAVLAGE
ncbi:serine hydrolase [Streptomyces calidiresistens]|uniref:Serine hydrolase n=1 Tax=Streptomyces calidiresistens TaxID=1485586 RepID=A0A7W3T4X4_9ACTN|nr:serine hydrolase [Streptomyces calidiresistens]